jgi:hypothetical protein
VRGMDTISDHLIKWRSPLGGRLTVRLQTLDLRIGVRIPASQPYIPKDLVLCEIPVCSKQISGLRIGLSAVDDYFQQIRRM